MRGEWGDKRWFVVLVEDQRPVEVLNWATWSHSPISKRPDNGHLVIAKDEIDAYNKALRGEYTE